MVGVKRPRSNGFALPQNGRTPWRCRLLNAGIALMILLAAVRPAAAQQPAVPSSNPDTRAAAAAETVAMARATWDTGWFQAEIFKALLERLGYRVAGPRTYDTAEFYRAVARGDVDLWANGWFPLHNAFIRQASIRDRIELVGYEVRGGALQGYLVDKATAAKYGITSLTDLRDPQLARIFDVNGNGKADLVGCDVGWGCELVIDHHLDAYQLHATVEQRQGDYSLLIHDTVFRYRQGKPVLFYTWTPNWTVGTLIPGEDVVWLEVPFPSLPEDQQGLEERAMVPGMPGCASDPCALGWPPNDIRAVANAAFLQDHPDIRRLLEAVKIPLEDIHTQNARMVRGQGSPQDLRRHAVQWIERNSDAVGRWLAAARARTPASAAGGKKAPGGPQPSIAAEARPLRVATMQFEPFVVFQGRNYTGFSIELWDEIAAEIGIDYEIYGVNSLAKLLDDVEREAADVAAAGIGITSYREMTLDFSHTYFESGLQIMVRSDPDSILGDVFSKVIAAIFSPQLFYMVCFLLFLLLISAHIIWFSERRRNPQFSEGYLKGIWQSFWWAAVTITTVGYGDKTPKGIAGRTFALIWMFSGFFILAYFTASVTSTVTVQELQGTIESPNDLYGKPVATVKSSTAAEYLVKMGIQPKQLANARDAIDVLVSGEVDAVVYDAPVLQHYASHEGAGKVAVVGPIFWQQFYGIALPTGSPYREPINRALLQLIESGRYQLLYKKWFGAKEF